MKARFSQMAMWAILASVSFATNYYAIWTHATAPRINIGGVDYYDILDANVWDNNNTGNYDATPTALTANDSMVMNGTANISISANATLKAFLVLGTPNAKHSMNLDGKTLTVTQNGLRSMTSGAKFTLSNGTLKLSQLRLPDRSTASAINRDNVFTVTGVGTTLDVDKVYFGFNMASKPGQGYGNKVIVTNGAFMAANVYLAQYESSSGAPNGLYVTGPGTVFSNKYEKSCFAISNITDQCGKSFSNEFVVADGAVVKGLGKIIIGRTSDLRSGVGHLLAFRGANTAHTFASDETSTLGLSQRFEVDGANVAFSSAWFYNYGIVTVKNGGNLSANLALYGEMEISGAGSRFATATTFPLGKANYSSARLFVKDGGTLSMPNTSLNIAHGGSTNASVTVTGGGTVVCRDIILGLARTNATDTLAPYGCKLHVAGEGSLVTFRSLTVGHSEGGGTSSSFGCCTNGHDNVVCVTDGGQMSASAYANIGFTCSSNALVVTSGGRFSCPELNIGRSRTGAVGTYKAEQVATDNRCVFADGTIEAATFSLRGIRTTCHATNGVVHATSTNSIDDVTAYLQIAGTNSLFKGDMAFHVKCTGGRIDFVLPRDGYARAPIQSDGKILINASTELVLRPPAEAGNTAKAYILMQVPASGLLSVPDNALAGLRSSLATLAAEDPRFADYYVKIASEGGCRRLLVKRHDGTFVLFK